MSLLLGLDIGTTSIKAALYDSQRGQVTAIATRPTPVTHPKPGWSEHDALALWQAVVECIRETSAGQAVSGVAIASMAEAGLLVDAGGQPVSPVIAWYDRRSEPQAAWIEQQVDLARLYRITGQRPSPSFGVTKLLWLRENAVEAFAPAARWLPVPAYLLQRLCGTAAVDYSIAARTLLFDQTTLTWSTELLDQMRLPFDLFPPVLPGGSAVGQITPRAAQETGLPENTLCALGGHDHLCAALAAGAHTPGVMIDSTGSANALLLLTPRFLPEPSLGERGYASYAFVLPGRYALKGGLKAAGSAVEWLARQLSPGETGPDYAALETSAREGIGRRAGPLWLPHLIGSGTPEGDRFSKAALVGVQFEHTSGDLFRGMLESLACWLRHNVEEMQTITGQKVNTLTLIGGITRLELLSQLKADILNHPVTIPILPEAAATGAALLAGLGCGVFHNAEEALATLRFESTRLEPDPTRAAWYDSLYRAVYRPLYETLKPVHQALNSLS